MSDPLPLRELLQSLGFGVAVVDAQDWTLLFENARFFEWFPPPPEADDADLALRFAGLDAAEAKARLQRGRPFAFDREVKVGPRNLTVQVRLRSGTLGERPVLVVECQNIAKQKEAEFMLDSYSRMAEKQNRELQKEKERVEKLLLNIMPRTVYEEMKNFGTATPQRFDQASVLLLDFVGFTEMAISREPGSLIAELNDLFTAFDRIVEMFGCERIKTIGDAYMAVSGLPEQNPEHAGNIARVALRFRRYIERRNAAHPTEWLCRIGIHTGPVIGSLVGVQKYVYDVFGPAVNLAARMEQLSEPMQITLCEETALALRDDFQLAERGEVEVKGFGRRMLYTLEGEYPRDGGRGGPRGAAF